MELLVRPARPDDPAAGLLFESARPYYTAYAGSERRALALLRSLWPRHGHAASYELCRLAVADGRIVGLMAGFPVRDADRLSRRFVGLTFRRLPPWRWPHTLRHLRVAGDIAPRPPLDAYYVDALAVDPAWRRRGIAHRLLDEAAAEARGAGLRRLALDTGLQNAPARALYSGFGFAEHEIRRVADERAEKALGGPGFVAYLKAL